MREVQSHVTAALWSVTGIEAVSRDKCHIFGKRCLEQSLRVSSNRHRHPQEEASLGMRPRDFVWEVLVQRLQHGIAPLAINLPNQLDVLIEEAVACNFVSYILIECGSMQISCLLQLHQLGDDIFWSHDPRQADSWRQSLGEGTEVNHIADGEGIVTADILPVEDDQRRNVLALVTQLAVGIVFYNRDAVLVGEQDQLMPPAFGESDACWILE